MKSCWSIAPSKRPSFEDITHALQSIKKDGPPILRLDANNSKRYRKAATVFAHVSKDPITILKDTGKNLGQKQNVLVAHSTKPPSAAINPDATYWESFTDLQMLDSEVFARTYEPVTGGHPFEFRKTGEVRARRMEEAFALRLAIGGIDPTGIASAASASAEGLIEQGVAGDYVVQNEAGDQWITDGKSMEAMYVEIREENPHPNNTTATTTNADPPNSSTQSTAPHVTAGQPSTPDVKLIGVGGGILEPAGDTPVPAPVPVTAAPVPRRAPKSFDFNTGAAPPSPTPTPPSQLRHTPPINARPDGRATPSTVSRPTSGTVTRGDNRDDPANPRVTGVPINPMTISKMAPRPKDVTPDPKPPGTAVTVKLHLTKTSSHSQSSIGGGGGGPASPTSTDSRQSTSTPSKPKKLVITRRAAVGDSYTAHPPTAAAAAANTSRDGSPARVNITRGSN